MTAAEALANPDLVSRVAGSASASPTTVRKYLHGEAPGRVKATFLRVQAALVKEGVALAPGPPSPRLASVPPADKAAL